MTLSIHSPYELIAALPHLLGFKPEESIVFVPMRSDLPVARVDFPTTTKDRELAWRSIRDGISRYAHSIVRWPLTRCTQPRLGTPGPALGSARSRRSTGPAASTLLDAGESILALSEYLGHADPGFTLRTYTHMMPSSTERTKSAIDAMLAGAPAPEDAEEVDGDNPNSDRSKS